MNEELQATNEELESSQEELQSINEELQTLNDQINQKVLELRATNDDMINLFRATALPTIFLDTRLCLRRVAEPASRVINVVAADVGRPLSDITHQLVGIEPAEVARSVLENLAKVEKEVASRDGWWYLMRAVPYRTSDNRIDGVVMTFTDVTELKHAETRLHELNVTLEQRVEERTALAEQRAEKLRQLALKLASTEQRERGHLAQLLHDSVQQTLVAARMKLQGAAGRAGSAEVREAIEKSSEMLRDAIATARSLTAELCPPVLFTGGLGSALRWLSAHMKEHFGLETEVYVDVRKDPTTASSILVYRCAQELLTNVAKHASTGRAEVRLEQLNDELHLRVADEGSGFDVARAEGSEGMGFGLFSVRERVQAMGGTMAIESAPGKGTRVSVRLPLLGNDQFADDELPVVSPDESEPEGERAVVRILIADDHQIVRCAIAELLSAQKGLRVVGHAANGREAVQKAWELLPDVVLMDVRMPVMDGLEATRRITSELPGTVIIGLSAHEDKDMTQKMQDAGALAFVNKNAPPEELLEALSRYGLRKTPS